MNDVQEAGLDLLVLPGADVDQLEPLEVIGATAAHDLGLQAYLDVVGGDDPVDEVGRHRGGRASRRARRMTTRRAKRARCNAA